MADAEQRNLTTLTVELLSAYVAKNEVKSDDLAGLIKTTHGALAEIDAAIATCSSRTGIPPAVSVRKSLASRDHLISMINGKPYKTLKRHASQHGMTPSEYRQRYKLPADYPMVAPAYSEQRRNVAARLGLGRKPAATGEPQAERFRADAPQAEVSVADAVPDAIPAGEAEAPPQARGRRKGTTPAPYNEAAVKAPRKASRQSPKLATSSKAPEPEQPAKKARRGKAAPQQAVAEEAPAAEPAAGSKTRRRRTCARRTPRAPGPEIRLRRGTRSLMHGEWEAAEDALACFPFPPLCVH